MSDEDYNSESDLDYVPSDGEKVSEEEESGDEEDSSLSKEGGTGTGSKAGRKRQKKHSTVGSTRKRKGGIKLDEAASEEKGVEDAEGEKNDFAERIAEEVKAEKEAQERNRADNLWSSFLSDVGQKSKSSTSARLQSSSKEPPPASLIKPTPSPSKSSTPSTESTPQKMTITKVFDFAGEEIKVSKEVSVNSKEAQEELKKSKETEVKQTLESKPSPGLSGVGVKRAGSGLGSVLSKISKKSKIGTLDKSKLDWDVFKQQEGIDEDLKTYNKGKEGYIERLNFLSRTDHRQFEIEKNLRLSSGKR
ncbi:hypothetical protein ScPMuIL_000435 [Solemya velum]